MTSKAEFQVVADGVGIEVIWKALTRDKIEFIGKSFTGLLTDTQILEGDANGFGVGTVFLFNFGPAAPQIPPFKERVVECDDSKHFLTFQGVEGGYIKLGFTDYLVTIKLDDIGNGKTLITFTLKYDIEEGADGTELSRLVITLSREYVVRLVSYLEKTIA